MARKLDKHRPYGTCHGEELQGAMYEQDGFLFDVHGDLCVHLMDDKAKERLRKVEGQEAAQAEADAAYKAAMIRAGLLEPDPPPAEPEAPVEGEGIKLGEAPVQPEVPTIDLDAWWNGTQKYPFFALKAAFKAQLGVNPTTQAEAIKHYSEIRNVDPATCRAG